MAASPFHQMGLRGSYSARTLRARGAAARPAIGPLEVIHVKGNASHVDYYSRPGWPHGEATADPDDCVHAPGWPRRAASAPLRHVAGRTRSRRRRCHADPAAAPSGASLMGSSQPMTSPLPAASQGRFIGSSHLVAHRVGLCLPRQKWVLLTYQFSWIFASKGRQVSQIGLPIYVK
jgi:hypothetical protein